MVVKKRLKHTDGVTNWPDEGMRFIR